MGDGCSEVEDAVGEASGLIDAWVMRIGLGKFCESSAGVFNLEREGGCWGCNDMELDDNL